MNQTTPTTKSEEAAIITLKEAFASRQFWHLFTMLYCSIFYGMYMAGAFKTFGSNEGNDITDKTLTLAGSLGASFNGLSRIFWG
jgi:hypothetical protein